MSDGDRARFWAAQGQTAHYFLKRLVDLPVHAVLLRRLTDVYMPMYSRVIPMLSQVHATEIIGRMLDVVVDDRRLEVWLSDDEIERAGEVMSRFRRPVVIHAKSRCSRNQNWPVDRWEALVASHPELTFVQLGSREESPIRGTVDMRGETSVRESVALLRHALAFVGVVSLLAHATNATGTPAVVLFGPSAPNVWAHPNQMVINKSLRCAPCIDTLAGHPCPYGAPCLGGISVAEVGEALRAQLTSSRIARTSSDAAVHAW